MYSFARYLTKKKILLEGRGSVETLSFMLWKRNKDQCENRDLRTLWKVLRRNMGERNAEEAIKRCGETDTGAVEFVRNEAQLRVFNSVGNTAENATLDELDLLDRAILPSCLRRFDLFQSVHPLEHPSKHNVLTIKPRSFR